ncbi:MAG: hypothetical protein IJC68_04950 [Firmicutes bacterium]|nr:hypothetical protein [Bacillota bacterium]
MRFSNSDLKNMIVPLFWEQLLVLLSFVLVVPVLLLKEQLLRGLFGRVEPAVMEAGLVYLRISAYSYPALAVYNAGVALYRSLGKTKTTMKISLVSNGINLVGIMATNK